LRGKKNDGIDKEERCKTEDRRREIKKQMAIGYNVGDKWQIERRL
jgi:hypothetical protein